MTTTKPLTGPLLESGSRAAPRSVSYVSEMFRKYRVKSYAIYVDHTTIVDDLPELHDNKLIGYYTFDIFLVGKEFRGKNIALLRTDQTPDDVDGWLVASTSRAAAFSLAQALMETDHEDQVIVRFYGGQTTEISAYMDLFSGDSETIVYLNHYYDRKYRIIFPIDVRYTIRECDGTVRLAGQRILRPGAITVFDTREMDLGEFHGYLRVELEVENLQVRVQPFIHFWADYVSEAGMCRTHQSGWAKWPANTVFNRGYLPLRTDLEAIVSIYNENDHDIQLKALLHFTREGREESIERFLEHVAAGRMSFQSISKLFDDVNKDGLNAAYVLLTCDNPLHRPNYYIALKGSHKFVDTYHQTGGKACHWAIPSYTYGRNELERIREVGMPHPWALDIPILPERFQIELFMGLLSLTLCDILAFEAELFNESGEQIFEEGIPIDGTIPLFTNINLWAEKRGIVLKEGGMLRLRPSNDADPIPRATAILFGLKHKKFQYFSTSFVGSPDNVNLPFYLSGNIPKSREYQYSPMTVSDHFCPGTCSDEFDSLFIVRHTSLLEGYTQTVEYRLDIIDECGRQYSVQRAIGPQQFDIFWLSEILEEANITSKKGHYTLWVKCYGTKLKPYHLLYRRSDHAMSMDDGSEGTLQNDPQISSLGQCHDKV
ncbi:MAG: hypothetical protein ACE5HI_02150 [bacterium]